MGFSIICPSSKPSILGAPHDYGNPYFYWRETHGMKNGTIMIFFGDNQWAMVITDKTWQLMMTWHDIILWAWEGTMIIDVPSHVYPRLVASQRENHRTSVGRKTDVPIPAMQRAIRSVHLIDLDDGKIDRKPLYLMVKTCRFSLKRIHWTSYVFCWEWIYDIRDSGQGIRAVP